MQPFAKNMAVEYAAKALPDGELAKALQDLKDGKTTIEEVTALIEGGTVSNAKPIYVHPIYCSFVRPSDSNMITFTCLIFNNSDTPFTKATFLAWGINFFVNYPNASILASGYKGLKPISRVKRHPNNPAQFISVEAPTEDGLGNDYYTIGESELAIATFTDGVNRIN